ncbi:MAG TPA: DUF4019 domain-containing protein [Phycisphaerae bacterium]|nr:DUF4019 domain-containing protein [Phycisphaerae bacterium]
MKTASSAIAILLAVFSAAPALAQYPTPPATAPSLGALLESGIYQEETVGDLNAAAKIYAQILTDAQANRPYAAQAAYRLAMIQLKQKKTQEAVGTLTRIVTDYPDQKELAAKAAAQIAQARSNLSDADIQSLVDAAVNKISTLGETDPQLPPTLATLNGIDGKRVSADLAPWLKSNIPEERRAAIYILWRGPLSNEDIAPAVPALLDAMKNSEDTTRGMAALALGGRKVADASDPIAAMTLHDQSPYARRAAAYALGLLGDQKAKPILEQAVKDTDPNVAANARAALKMLAMNTTDQNDPATKAAIKDAAPVAQHWAEFLDNAQYAQSYDSAAAVFRNAMTSEQWQSTIRSIREPLGKTLSRTQLNATCMVLSSENKTPLPNMPPGKYVIVQFKTDFENKKGAIETITPRLEPDGKWHVAGYFIK